jgi:aspartate carbamoyltransferase regulatory subunit
VVLKLDVDWMPPREWIEEWRRARVLVLEQLYGLRVLAFYVAPSDRGFHAWIHVEGSLSDEDVNRLQFVLGDDATRCKINQWKIEAGVRDWNRLFSKVIWRRRSRYYARCQYCGNVIPLVGFVRKDER